MTVITADEFSTKSRWHWLIKTKAGIALGYTALLGLLVGVVVTSQTLYAATTASAKEYAILLAMGIPRWRVTLTVLIQSFWVGLFGIVVAATRRSTGWPTLGRLAGVHDPLPLEPAGRRRGGDTGDGPAGRLAGPAVGPADRADAPVA